MHLGLEAYGDGHPTNGTAADNIELSEGHKEEDPLNDSQVGHSIMLIIIPFVKIDPRDVINQGS